jgi:hypothetical protein
MDHAHHGHQALADHAPAGAGLTSMAASATLHCLTGCAVGEVTGLVLGTALGLGSGVTVALSIGLAFAFGYSLSVLPLLRAGLSVGAALTVVLAADTLSIATMEVVDNLVMVVVPGALEAGLGDPLFWVSMAIALGAAFLAAFPVNRHLLARGRGHALTHHYHHGQDAVVGARARIPSLSTALLSTAIAAFLLGGLVAALAQG